jgi:hypothetical protein
MRLRLEVDELGVRPQERFARPSSDNEPFVIALLALILGRPAQVRALLHSL